MSRVPLAIALALATCRATPVATAESESSSSSAGSSSTGEACEAPQSDPEQPVVIRVRNDTDAIRWFVRHSCMFPLQLDAPDGEGLRQRAFGWCWECEGVVADGCEPWCEDHCDEVTVGIAPGGVFETTWHGRLHETVSLACESCGAMCDVASAAPSGTYRTAVQVFEQCEPIPPGTCECPPDEHGVCEIWSPASLRGDGIELARDFGFPATNAVELVIAD